jgi:hypothetical protein
LSLSHRYGVSNGEKSQGLTIKENTDKVVYVCKSQQSLHGKKPLNIINKIKITIGEILQFTS